MTALGGSIADFYGPLAELYALVSDDRDFGAQTQALVDLVGLQPGQRFLELFAGPAWHARVLRRQFAISSVAVDCSAGMQRLAIADGTLPREAYLLSHLPRMPPADQLGGPFDAASILRYSVGYLNPRDLLALLQQLAIHVKPGGCMLFELHDLDLVRSDFTSLDIRDRRTPRADGTSIRCVWPAAPLRWQPDDWVVEMDVLVQHLDGERVIEEHRFQSVERMYARAEIEALALATGLWRLSGRRAPAGVFGGPMLVLERA